ncbi:DUF418 domain-containing protein [Sphaerisporangium sp. TRM90804]|uniref:DUF418 domain-containing protein n=1 Tax=Sphaerisporangium sp. TRM90804 TaxID=3031113 RepID=UPI0024485862|nr:DUF418 domain-containing protein [Sphaerisporangium sp. TRM90804]MDH2426091.1 DUF418 domain-containing protein [Sphaerisporangium sp. TRM90804]
MADTRRIQAIDVLRGIAVLGTLGTNIWIFTDPRGPAGVLEGLAPTEGVAGVVERFLRFLTNGKFLALLTLLFGVGLEIQYRSALRRGVRWPGRYVWRAALLFVEGLLHYILIFEFDVLMGYAVASVLVACLIGRGDRAVRVWMVVAGTLHLALTGLLTAALLSVQGGPAGSTGVPQDLFTRGAYLDQVAERLAGAGLYRLESVFILPMTVLLFLLGSRLMRAGALGDDARGRRLRTRLMIGGLGAGVPLNLLTTFAGGEWVLVDRYLLPPFIAVGLLALVTEVTHRVRRPGGAPRLGLTAVGRTALSCYVLQNLLAAALCYGWGLGLAARLDGLRPWWVPVAWAVICAVFMIAAVLWLRRFERGPLETAWQWAYQAPRRRRATVPAP